MSHKACHKKLFDLLHFQELNIEKRILGNKNEIIYIRNQKVLMRITWGFFFGKGEKYPALHSFYEALMPICIFMENYI